MNVHCILLAYALDVRTLVRTVMADGVTLHLFLHSNRHDVVASCFDMQREYENVRWYNYQTNRGNGRSCNDGIEMALKEDADAILILNDDLTLTWDDFKRLAEGCLEHPEAGLITCNGYNVSAQLYHDLTFCCFGINRRAIEQVGFFDQNFHPTYFDDTDYKRRCALLGVKTHNIGDTQVVHQGSTTIRAVPFLQKTFPLNQAYYEKKHGGPPGSETFVFPFNNPDLSWTISAQQRDNPYPEHQRLGIVS